MVGNASLTFYDSQNIDIGSISFGISKASKPILKFDVCDGITLNDFAVDSSRTLMQVTNSDNAKITFVGITADFSKLDKALQYSNGLQITCRNCTNTGKALEASVSDKTVTLPIIGDDFGITGNKEMNIKTVRGNREKGSKITLRCDSNDVYFEKGGNILLGEYTHFPKATSIEMEFNGKKWTINTVPFAVTTTGDCTVAVGETAKYTVSVIGGSGKFTYRWYYSKDGGKTWGKAGFDGNATATMSFKTVARYYTYLFKCRVYDSATKKEYYSDVVKLLEPEVASFIKTQPKDCSAKVGDTIAFTVEVAGSAKSYVWYRSKDGGKTWGKVYYDGYRTNSITVPVEKYMNNYLFYCVITDTNGEKYETDKAKITLKK